MNFRIACKSNKICEPDCFKLLLSAFSSLTRPNEMELLTCIFEISIANYL